MKYRVLQIGKCYYPQKSEDGVDWNYFEGFETFTSLTDAKADIAKRILSETPERIIHEYP